MILITVFKDKERYESDLRKSFKQIRAQHSKKVSDNHIWELAKGATSKVDFSQKVNVDPSFFVGKKPKELKDDIYSLAWDIAKNRRFKTTVSVDI